MQEYGPLVFVEAARARVAAHGLKGLSLRAVAADAGASLGALNYHMGGKGALVERLIVAQGEAMEHLRARWRARAARLDLRAPVALAAFVESWLDEAAGPERLAALVGAELLLEAGLAPEAYAALAHGLSAEDTFWAAICASGREAEDALRLGHALAAYLRDELPFTLACGADADYRLLRRAVLMRLAEGLSGAGDALAGQFSTLVEGCGGATHGAVLPVDLPEGSKKAELAAYVGDAIVQAGVAAVSHRQVAARAGLPNSTVAHYFRTRQDLLHAGIGALILAMRAERDAGPKPSHTAGEGRAELHGAAVVRATQAIALAAARDAELVPFALDMRRRRAEDHRDGIAEVVGAGRAVDGAAVQAAVMVIVGSGLAAMARGEGAGQVISAQDLAQLRAAAVPG